ncbi:MAG: hypothetical protein MK188_09580 [Gammaproteobacteria bacterium]|nr:hypothetical protein [Gammaproteobacteria bacterium]
MVVNEKMQKILHELSLVERNEISRCMNLAANDLGNELICLYYSDTTNEVRSLIKDFLTSAGVVWLRKLLTNDTSAIVSSRGELAGLDDYLVLLAANDKA